jgi:hypothetical protein
VASFLKLARLATQVAATRKALERPLAAPVGRLQRSLAFATHRAFMVSLAISAAFVFGLLSLGGHAAWLAWLRVVLGLVLLSEGLLLATDWSGARHLMLWRMRRGDPAGVRLPLTHRLVRRLASPVLQFLGIAWLGAGIYAVTIGLQQLV